MRKDPRKQAYRDTAVSAGRTRDQIEELLEKHGCTAFAELRQRSSAGRGSYGIRFRREDRMYRMVMGLGETAQDERQNMRVLYWSLKGLLTSAAHGMLQFEDVLLAYAELPLPGGGTTTVAEIVQRQLRAHELPDLGAPLALPPPDDSE